MEKLIRQAFENVEEIGPHVHSGHYDLMGPDSGIIVPSAWDTTIEPDMKITMHMWPLPEPKEEPPPCYAYAGRTSEQAAITGNMK